MSHINTGVGEIDHTASAYIIRTDQGEPKIMLHMHKKLGMLIQFGGHIELNETPWQAIKHELAEESGYELSQLQILQPRGAITKIKESDLHPVPAINDTHRFDDNHRHSDRGYAFITDQEPQHSPDEGESTDIRLFTLEQLEQIPQDQIPSSVRSVGMYLLEICLVEWEPIPTSKFSS